MLAALRRAAGQWRNLPALQPKPSSLVSCRWTSAIIRRRRRALHQALADPTTHPAKIRKLEERAAQPSHDLLRYLAENKVGKVQTQADRKQLWYDLQYKKYAPVFIGQVKPRMRFWTAALEESQLPLARLPEIAVCGRSNSGKSTLLNYLCGQHSADVKRMPGSTTELVFWQVGRPAQICLVDLPGYGFAEAPEEKRLQWTEFTLWYVRARRNLKRLLMLIDARQGLKPSDKEMIAYLERHNVSWQIVVTKCDRVKGKELAKRLTILQEELTGYRKMAGDPIPVSALKRKGMDALRETLNNMKVMKEVVKEGIKIRVYDMLEQRRLRNAERNRRRKERKAEAAAAAKATEDATKPAAEVSSEFDGEDPDLHTVLGDWSGRPKPGPSDGEASPAGPGPAASVATAHYSLDDRDSKRVDSFISTLFPDLGQFSAVVNDAGGAEQKHMEEAPGQVQHHKATWEGNIGVPDQHSINLACPLQSEAEEGDTDSDDDLVGVRPQVRRFEPTPLHARTAERQQRQEANLSSSRFPSIGRMMPEEGGAATPKQVHLRQGWLRPAGDQIYEADDFVSPEDYAAGFRRWAPPAPAASEPGQFMAQARQRYEREWAMELDDVEQARAGAPDAKSNATPKKKKAARDTEELTLPRMPFITQEGAKPIPKGNAKWKFLGRPPARILKMKKPEDVAKVFRLKNFKRRRTNLGHGLEWDEAKEKWMSWYKKNKRSRWDKIQEADSPKKDDVDAAFELRQERLQRRRARLARPSKHARGRGREVMAPRDESAMPEWGVAG